MLLTEHNCLIHITQLIRYQLQSLLRVAHTTYKHQLSTKINNTVTSNYKGDQDVVSEKLCTAMIKFLNRDSSTLTVN